MNGERSTAISQLLANPHVWRGRSHDHQFPGAQRVAVATGFEVLDACFPGGGWPVGALTEVFAEHQGVGELSLFMPALARMSRSGGADAGRTDKECGSPNEASSYTANIRPEWERLVPRDRRFGSGSYLAGDLGVRADG